MQELTSDKEIELIFDALICLYGDLVLSQELIQALTILGNVHLTEILSRKIDVVNKIYDADFDGLRSIAAEYVTSDTSEETLSAIALHSVRYRLSKGVEISEVLTEMDRITNPLYAANATQLLVCTEEVSIKELSNDLLKQLYKLFFGSSELQTLLNYALQFKDLLLLGKQRAKYKADSKSYIYVFSYVRIIYPSKSKSELSILAKLCSNVQHVNQFGSHDISEKLSDIIDASMSEDVACTLQLLYSHPTFALSLRHYTGWTPLGRTAKVPDTFDYLVEYARKIHTKFARLRPCNVSELGASCAVSLRRNGANIYDADSCSEVIFPVTREVRLDADVWSVCSDCVGRYALFGTAKGQSYVYNFRSSCYTQIVKYHTSKIKFNRPPGTERIKAHPSMPGVFAITGGGLSTIADVSKKKHMLVQYVVPSNSYGDVCWHPRDKDLLFYCNDTIEGIILLRGDIKLVVKEFAFSSSFMCMSYCGDSLIALLSAKIHKKSQVLVISNIETGERMVTKLPSVQSDGAYSTLVCSQWDKRTFVSIAPPNMIVVGDRLGKRPLRVIYGPKQEKFMIKSILFGPMDKYILTGSEERSKTPKAWLLNRFTGERVGYLEGHLSQVNDVSFVNHPRNPMLLTGADDSRVIFYSIAPMC